MRVHDKDIDGIQSTKRLHRGTASVTARGADDGHPLSTAVQSGLEHLPDQLHGKVFERKCRPVKQLEQKVIAVQLYQGRPGFVTESGIGTADNIAELCIAERVTYKRLHHPKRHILITQPLQSADVAMAHLRDRFGHIQTTVTGKAG